VLGRLQSAYRGGARLVLLFDYDGTLAPIVPHPRLARLALEMERVLEALSRQPRLFVGIVSGRMIDDLKAMVGLPGLYYCGTNGLELDLHGERIVHPQAGKKSGVINDLALRLEAALAEYSGAWVEKKRFGLTVHYRAVARHLIEDLRLRTEQVLRPFGSHMDVLDGPMAVEVTLALGWTKGSAVGMIVEDAGQDVFPLYAGDEDNDGPAFEAVTALGGIAVGVGPRAPATVHDRLPGPAALANFLSDFLASLRLGGERG
jgi:trehalose-phosphatase